MYSLLTCLILTGMIVAGTARSVGVKLLYQLGFDNALFVALLYLLGQSLALGVYAWTRTACGHAMMQRTRLWLDQKNPNNSNSISILEDDYVAVQHRDVDVPPQDNEQEEEKGTELAPMGIVPPYLSRKQTPAYTVIQNEKSLTDDSLQSLEEQPPPIPHAHSVVHRPLHHSIDEENGPSNPCVLPDSVDSATTTSTSSSSISNNSDTLPHHSRRPTLCRQGSQTGLTPESSQAVAWIHHIPWHLKPLIPGLFNLANAALKWASFVYVAASLAEMLMSGCELVLSVVVARVVRQRLVSPTRWAGVGLVAIGLVAVHAVADWHHQAPPPPVLEVEDATTTKATTSPEPRHYWIGGLLILGQCVTAVGQDIAEEVFLQEADYPATLLLGMEGLYGLALGIPIYMLVSPVSIRVTWEQMEASSWEVVYMALLTLIFTITGLFNILTTGVTSSMTRNMWKNVRTIAVWVSGLVLYYAGGNDELGEPWVIPDSFWILLGFGVMLSGIYVYYKHQ